MDTYKSTEVYNYLDSLYQYLIGDLNEFKELCKRIEVKELTLSAAKMPLSNAGSMYPFTSSLSTSSTTTSQTTRYPGNSDTNDELNINDRQKLFRLTIPITLSLFATIDCIGFLVWSNNDPTKTYKNFRDFFRKSTIPVTDLESDFINNVFRQGLSHVYFPKLNLGISYHSSNPNDKLIFRSTDDFLILNVNKLEEIVTKVFEGIKDDKNLYSDMDTKYQGLVSEYQTKYSNDIKNYKV